MIRPSTRIKIALRAALRRTYGYAALRVLRRGIARAFADHQVRTLGSLPYTGSVEREAIRTSYARGIRKLMRRWPRLDLLDPRAEV